MSRRFVALPPTGLPGVIEDEGREVLGTVRMTGEIYESGESPPPLVKTLGELKAMPWYDAATQSFRIPFGRGFFIIPAEVITGLSDSTRIRIGMSHHTT